MEITTSPEQVSKANSGISSTSAATSVRPSELLAQLQAGQTIFAKVEKILANNQVELRVANQLVKADTPIQLAAGQSIKLLVEDTSKGLILRIAQQASQVETLARAWRTVLPKQQPIIDVVKQLVNTVANNKAETANNNIANQLRSAIQTLVNSLPSVKTVTQPEGLRQAIQDSGVRLEAQLRQALISGSSPKTDNNIKANFLRLAQAALQVQENTKSNASLLANDVARTTATTNKSNQIDAYTSLLTATSKSLLENDKLLTSLRPLLPPLPLSTEANSNTQNPNRLIASLPPLLQRLFNLPSANLNQTSAAAVASNQGPVSQQVFSSMLVDLINQMESGLARIQQHQLSNVTGDDAIRHFLNLELPVFNGKNFENIGIRFEWDKYQQTEEDDTDKQHQWRVILNFDFDDLGKTQVIIRAGLNEIHTDFKSESKRAQEMFEQNKNMLQQGLQKQGLTPGKFTFSTGEIDTELNNQHDKNLLKTKA